MVSDIFATAWEGLTWSGFQAGDSVAVFGAGPVGQMAAYSAILRGASRVYSVDRIQRRLDLAASIGAIPINYANGTSASSQILAHEPLGVARAVDAVGMESRNSNGTYDEGLAVQQAFKSLRPSGGLGVVGVYDVSANAPGHPRSATAGLSKNVAPFDMSDAFLKGASFHAGGVDAREPAAQLVDLITAGRANPSYIISSKINITQAPEYYRRFAEWKETKVVIRF